MRQSNGWNGQEPVPTGGAMENDPVKKPTDQTLAKMIGIGEREIARIFHVFDFLEQDRASLRRISAHIERRMPGIVGRFYELQLNDTETSLIIGDADTLDRVKMSTQYYIASLFDAIHDADYVSSRLRIGKVHQRIGVTPRLYMRGHRNLQAVLEDTVETICMELGWEKDVNALKAALHKILIIDTQLIFEAYVATNLIEIEATKDEVDRYASQLGIKVDVASPRLHDLMHKDALTSLLNRRALMDFLEHELAVAGRYGLPLCLAYIDLNHFKEVNDRAGHEAGDEVLRSLAAALQRTTRSVDLSARLGGDEFCILMPRTTADQCCQLLQRLAAEFDLRNTHAGVTLSVGLAQVGPDKFCSAEEFLKSADALMYHAKPLAHASGNHHFHIEGGPALSWPKASCSSA